MHTYPEPLIGFIGMGNMASAIIQGMLASQAFLPAQIMISNPTTTKLTPATNWGCVTTTDNRQVASACQVLLIAVKPNLYAKVLQDIKTLLTPDTVVVSMAAGLSLQWLASHLNPDTPVIRTMPNTPATVQSSMTALVASPQVSGQQLQQVRAIFNTIGNTTLINESLMDAFTGVAGCSPAYAYLFIDALADAGVHHGLTKTEAIQYAAQALKGAAEMVLTTDSHPVQLKDQVCSPGGATVAAVASLEAHGFRHAVIQATTAAVARAQEMGKAQVST